MAPSITAAHAEAPAALMHGVATVDLAELFTLVRLHGAQVIDTREAEAFARAHIAGAISIPMHADAIGDQVEHGLRFRDSSALILYADDLPSGERLAREQRLVDLRLAHPLYVYRPGFAEWTACGLPVASDLPP